MAEEKKVKRVNPQEPSQAMSASGVTGGGKGPQEAKVSDASTAKKVVAGGAAAGTAAAAPVAGQVLGFMALINWLKSLLMAGLAAVTGFLASLAGALAGAAAFVVSGFMAAGAALAAAVGGLFSATVGAVIVALGSIGSLVLAGTVVSSAVVSGNIARNEGQVIDDSTAQCMARADKVASDAADSPAGTDPAADEAKRQEMAKLVYSVFAGVGMSDENVAGPLGNWDMESGIDSTAVESIYGEPYRIGPLKQKAWDAGFTAEAVLPADYRASYPAIKVVGLGFGQWTNERQTLLLDYADAEGKDWHDAELQLKFMLVADDPVRIGQIRHMVDTDMGVNGSTEYFMSKWEGIQGNLADRQAAAQYWYSQMGSWEADTSYKSLLDQSHSTVVDANKKDVTKAQSACTGNSSGGSGMYDGDLGDGEWTNPCPECKYLTSNYGIRGIGAIDTMNGGVHHGADLASRPSAYGPGADLVAVEDMEIVLFYPTDGCLMGRGVNPPNFYHAYCHGTNFSVREGDVVKRGTIIGQESNVAGNIATPVISHLHYELFAPTPSVEEFKGNWWTIPFKFCYIIDPETVMPQKGVEWSDPSFPSNPVPEAYKAARKGSC